MVPRTLIALMMMLTAGSALAGNRRPAIEVCAASNPAVEVDHPQLVVNQIFSKIGVSVNWKSIGKCTPDAIRITWSLKTPDNELPGAMAYALPFEGTNIVVFLDRIKRAHPELVQPLLGHVLAHEIGHILQGTVQHSDDGVMKAAFTRDEIIAMQTRSRAFTSRDAELIHRGLTGRAGQLANFRAKENLTIQAVTAAATAD